MHLRREEIEEQLMNYNKKHYQKIFNTPIYEDKICNQLQNNKIQDQILTGILQKEQCDNKNVFRFHPY